MNETLEWHLRAKPLTTAAQTLSFPNRHKAQTQSTKVKYEEANKDGGFYQEELAGRLTVDLSNYILTVFVAFGTTADL